VSTVAQTPTGDIQITNGRTTLVTDPVQAGCIKLRNRFQLFLGEWFRDTRVGLPWFQYILIKNPSIPVVQNILRRVIVSTPPFISATVTVTPPDGQRRASASFTAVVDPKVSAGTVVTAAALDAPYIVVTPPRGN